MCQMSSCFLRCLGHLPVSDAWSLQSEGGLQVPSLPSSSALVWVRSLLCCAVAEMAWSVFSPPADGRPLLSSEMRVCVALHHCLADDKKGAAIRLLLLSWLFWEWISVSFSVRLLVSEVGTFPFLSTFTSSLLTLV